MSCAMPKPSCEPCALFAIANDQNPELRTYTTAKSNATQDGNDVLLRLCIRPHQLHGRRWHVWGQVH